MFTSQPGKQTIGIHILPNRYYEEVTGFRQ